MNTQTQFEIEAAKIAEKYIGKARYEQQIQAAAEKAARTGNHKDLHRYLEMRRNRS